MVGSTRSSSRKNRAHEGVKNKEKTVTMFTPSRCVETGKNGQRGIIPATGGGSYSGPTSIVSPAAALASRAARRRL
jgi:hypothetical protein